MAEYKLSELNTIDTVRSDDLLHLRVIKRSDMLGDEDRKMTYANFLASFRLERFLQLAGGNMTGNLGIVKLTYGGKDLLDPTGSSEIILGDVAKTFKINANGLALKVSDATRTAFVYHTLNKPSPADLGMRTNEENDARYSRLAANNIFTSQQVIQANGEAIRLKNSSENSPLYIRGQDSTGANRWYVGNDSGSDDVIFYNNKTGSLVNLTNDIAINKTLRITGQVQPSDFSNLDARYFTQNAADQRFARLTENNTFSGANNFTNYQTIISDGSLLRLKPATANGAVFVQAYAGSGSESWYLGQPDGTKQDVNLFNQMTGATMRLSTEFFFSKPLNVTGQVKPSDFANFDSRYIPAATLSSLARNNSANTFTGAQTILADGVPLVLQNTQPMNSNGVIAKDSTGAGRWFIGNFDSSDVIRFHNYKVNTYLELRDVAYLNKPLRVEGQVIPTDVSNFDARYYTQSVANTVFSRATAMNATTYDSGWVKIATVTMPQTPSTATLRLYGGTGFNVGSFNQCGKNELVLRSGNANPSGLNAVLYRSTDSGVGVDVCTVSVGGDNYDVYLQVGPYAMGTLVEFQGVNGAVITVHSAPTVSSTKPANAVDGYVVIDYNTFQKPSAGDVGAYTKAETDQKIATAISNSTDLNKIYPVGMVTFFASNVNPNTAFAGTTWAYLSNGQFRTIRIASSTGEDVGSVGGSDSKSIAVGHLPSHTHSFSATTSTHDHGTIGTSLNGWHGHSVSGSTAGAGGHAHNVAVRYLNTSQQFAYVGAAGQWAGVAGYQATEAVGDHAHGFSGSAAGDGNHTHTVTIGAHAHTLSGNTGATGSGAAFSVLNTYIKLMAWVRTA
ncbi:tail fiber protein [Shigella phage Henu12]|nr:tail fiber protein [Shigella phage Henu12]